MYLKFINSLNKILNSKNDCYVIYSSLWKLPFLSGKDLEIISDDLHKIFLKKSKKSTILIPAFTDGYNSNGIINYKYAKINTGYLANFIFKKKIFKRTLSAFFSFLVLGNQSKEILALKPKNAWGEGSLYEWLYEKDAKIITIGTHPTHCSFTHYAEWLFRNKIKYRKKKYFEGYLINKQKKYKLRECLFVRKNKNINNNFEKLLKDFEKEGMEVINIKNFKISVFSCKKKIKVIKKKLRRNPNYLIKT